MTKLSTSAQQRRRRLKAYIDQMGKCFWCQRDMTLDYDRHAPLPDNACTLDHLVARRDQGRLVVTHDNKPRTVAACHACNHARSLEQDPRRKRREVVLPLKLPEYPNPEMNL